MGEMADYYAYYDCGDEDGLESEYWVTSDGEYVKPEDMSLAHLQNAINYLSRKNPQSEWISEFRDELKRRQSMGIRPAERSGTSTGKDWLDNSGCFLFGKYKGESAEDIAETDPTYIRWIVDNVEDVSDEDRGLLEQYLSWKNRGKR